MSVPGDPVHEAATAALAGHLIVIPTDTVYGVGTRPDERAATARLFRAKDRPRDLVLPVLCPGVETTRELAGFDERANRLAEAFWPGPLTIVLPRSDRSRDWDLGADEETIGLRVPRHRLALAVLVLTGPLAVTSANRSGEPTPQACDGVREVFRDDVEIYICDDRPSAGLSSTVVDLAHGKPRVLRAGALSPEAVLEAAG